MENWTYITARKLLHESGFILELVSGSWRMPEEIKPIPVRDHSPAMTARLIREGLKFTKRQNIILKKKTVSKPGPNTLSLKKVTAVC